MDNFISCILSAFVFLSFVVGLAFSIGTPPFFVIVFSVCAMLLIDLYQDNLGFMKKMLGKK